MHLRNSKINNLNEVRVASSIFSFDLRAILQISHFINGNEAIQEEVVIGHVSEYPTKVRRRVPSG